MQQCRFKANPLVKAPVQAAAVLGVLVGLASIPLGAAGIAPPEGAAPVRFGRDIRPILSDRCFKCHGPDAAARQAGLRLDERESAVANHDGAAPIAPGDLDKSELWRRINERDPDEVMPPPTARKKPLSADEKELIRRWILDGATYERHWAFQASVRPAAPAVKAEAWCRNEIDRFILANLEHEGISPAPAADAPTLARRIYLDLTGLPPTPEEIDAFIADGSDDAAGRLVDRLMTQEPYRSRYAERMATPWLDQARYADTNGIHTDAGKQMWLWRDWVLKAYRDNMPFDRFVIEQLAGDLLPGATVDQQIASGFNRNHVMTDEGGAIAEEYLVEYAAERASTTGSVFLGLTMGCARCHDHKFDPITQADFYSMFAFFDSVEEPGLYSQLPDPQRAFEPFVDGYDLLRRQPGLEHVPEAQCHVRVLRRVAGGAIQRDIVEGHEGFARAGHVLEGDGLMAEPFFGKRIHAVSDIGAAVQHIGHQHRVVGRRDIDTMATHQLHVEFEVVRNLEHRGVFKQRLEQRNRLARGDLAFDQSTAEQIACAFLVGERYVGRPAGRGRKRETYELGLHRIERIGFRVEGDDTGFACLGDPVRKRLEVANADIAADIDLVRDDRLRTPFRQSGRRQFLIVRLLYRFELLKRGGGFCRPDIRTMSKLPRLHRHFRGLYRRRVGPARIRHAARQRGKLHRLEE